MKLPERKPNRLNKYDYSSDGVYFITICVRDMKCILSEVNVGATIGRPNEIHLTQIGKIVDEAINEIPKHYYTVFVDKYVIMPNNIHILLRIDRGGRPMVAPTISRVIQQMKGYITKKVGYPIWQKLFHDHIIRGEKDYLKIAEYIENNPYKWKDDCFYCE
ncbi:MAG: hypothetical protein IJM96_06240 [Clostridia bacterium]|nr:hypothetical protein [Clostridia bacterium]